MMEALSIWTIYNRSSEDHACYIARRFEVAGASPVITQDIMVSPSLKGIRIEMEKRGLVCAPRDTRDDPEIVESWF